MFDMDRLEGSSRCRLRELAISLRALAADLEQIGTEILPLPATLEAAPLLHRWELGIRPQPCLIGERHGHPLLEGDGRVTVTSPLWALSTRYGIARTQSRWYRLGRCRIGAGALDA